MNREHARSVLELLSPQRWADYELLDCGSFEKLERFGQYITIRPEPQAVWDKILPEKEWEGLAHVRFIAQSSSAGIWKKLKPMPDQWNISYRLEDSLSSKTLKFKLSLTAFKHVGIFPEQATNWDYIYNTIKQFKTPQPRLLNLFAYTGGASLAAKAAGAEVVHLDSIKQIVHWARENMELSHLNSIRWIVEDALTFVKRELKREKKYQGIILDPPAYGHGPKGEKWKLEDHISEMVKSVLTLLDESEHFLILNAYSLGFSSLIIENLMRNRSAEDLITGELYLHAASGVKLPLGVFGRIRKSIA